MNCFVIMPFKNTFNDVYAVIKESVKDDLDGQNINCIRLDEISKAGRITDDLINELNNSLLCIADISGCNPNVMWEVGYAIALNKPVVTISNNIEELPFDIKDLRTIHYSRDNLFSSLKEPLVKAIKETIKEHLIPNNLIQNNNINDGKKIISITGSFRADPSNCKDRIPKILEPFLASNVHWYCGSMGFVDLYVLRYLIENKQKITVVGYNSYDYSEDILNLMIANKIPFIDAQKLQLASGIQSSNERDLLFLMKSDLQILIWNGKSLKTEELIDQYKRNSKDFLVSYI